jgi:hypothetical protein
MLEYKQSQLSVVKKLMHLNKREKIKILGQHIPTSIAGGVSVLVLVDDTLLFLPDFESLQQHRFSS